MAVVSPEPRERARPPGEVSPPDGRPTSVFWIALVLMAAFVAAGALLTDPVNTALTDAVGAVVTNGGWLYLLVATGFLGFVIYLAFSRYGSITLGRPGEKPEFGLFSWFAMLFQAGMGIGLLFWGVAEPVLHRADPPLGQARAGTPEAANLAMQYAFFHWALHPWAIYAVVGIAVGYFSYRRGSGSLRISAVFEPLLGKRVHGPIGVAIDVLAVVATLFGIATSLGSGTLQIDAGLNHVFGLPQGTGTQLGIIGVTAFAYLLSASTPITHGIRWLSNVSVVLAVVLLGYFLVVGPTVLQLNALTQETGLYLSQIVPMSLRTNAFAEQADPWLANWTIFFWASWIAWAPYVGAFVARISRGRTIRQFVLGVLLAPSLFTILWFSVLGATGIAEDREAGGAIAEAAGENPAVAMFEFLERFPLAGVVAVLTIFLVWIFFVAGADAGTVVLGSMASGGALDAKRWMRLTWGVVIAAVAGVLLVVGGLDALQNGAIVAATPFGLLMVLMCWALMRALRADEHREG